MNGKAAAVKRPRTLKTTYSAYYYRDEPAPDFELTAVGPGTPCGEYMRRFWQPVAFSRDLGDLPVRLRILGENLVVFRAGSGQVGLLQLHCSHRGTSLEYGRVEAAGLRCCYHGWLYGTDGRVLETPGEPADSTFKDRMCHGAYPTHEYNGIVFAYLGPPDRKPPFPFLDTFDLPGYRVFAGRRHTMPCNWLQIKDNAMDPIHTVFLHAAFNLQFTPSFMIMPEVEYQETPAGTIYIATRRVGDNVWVRINDFVYPNIHQYALEDEDGTQVKFFSRPYSTMFTVPIDDANSLNISFMRVPDTPEFDDARVQQIVEGIGQVERRSYEESQRDPGDFEAQSSQRPIAIHAVEHLGATDRGITLMRKLLREEIRAVVQEGKDPSRGFFSRAAGAVIPTYSQNTVVRIPPAPTPDEDRRLLQKVGRKVAAGYYVKHPEAALPVHG